MIRLNLPTDDLVPLRHIAHVNGVAGGYSALTQGIDTVSSAVQPITWRVLIDAVRGIGEIVIANELDKYVSKNVTNSI